jgi:phosphoglycerate dehydrogenase-like enzyme
VETAGVELVAEQAFRNLQAADLPALLGQADAVVLPAPCALLPEHMAGSHLRSIAIAASGFEWLDLQAATTRGIVVTNAPVREGAEVVADMAFGLMLAVARQIPYHDAAIRAAHAVAPAGGGDKPLSDHERLMSHGNYPRGIGTSLWRKTLGIVGFGNIGQAVARRAAGFEMTVLAATPNPRPGSIPGVEFVAQDELLQRSDVVSLHARLNAHSTGMIGEREFGLMRPGAFLINTARQQLVDEAALVRALRQRRIAGAALDDPPSPALMSLLGLPNVVFTTHLGNRAAEGMQAVLRAALGCVLEVFCGRQPPHLLNPEVYRLHPKLTEPILSSGAGS